MFKKEILKYFPVLVLGSFLGLLLGIMALSMVYTFKGGGKLLQQDWISYFLVDPARKAETLILLFGFTLLGMTFFGIKILWDEIEEKNRENQKLKEVSQAKTEFVSFTTHQLRTPLAALRFSLKMFLEGDFGKLNEEQERIAKANFEAVENLMVQVSNLLDISKIELGQLTITKTLLSLEKFLTLIIKLLEKYIPLAQKKNIFLDYFVPKEVPRASLEVDWDKITQVLEVLLENAPNYTPSGGKIFLKIRPESNFLTISVSDTGIGIPLKEQGKIFTKFFRASNAKKILSRGTGLGLYLAKFFVENHNGKIWFETQENWGTTFYFTLPYYQPKVAAEKALEKL